MSLLLSKKGERLIDLYPELPEGEPFDPAQPVLLTLERFLREGAVAPQVAVSLPNTVDVLGLPAAVLACPMLALNFPSFADGRAYSQAKLLRRSAHYGNELRAIGQAVVYDQLSMLAVCGFSQFLLRADQNADSCSILLEKLSKTKLSNDTRLVQG